MKLVINKILFFLILLSFVYTGDSSHVGHGVHLSPADFNLYWLIPFVGILLSIALMPLSCI